MSFQLIRLHAHPNELAATKVGSVVPGGAFFLDFSQPLEPVKRFGRWGWTVGLLVPVVHEANAGVQFVVAVSRGDPYFPDLQKHWKARYPTVRPTPSEKVDGLKAIADFATQFPDDARAPDR